MCSSDLKVSNDFCYGDCVCIVGGFAPLTTYHPGPVLCWHPQSPLQFSCNSVAKLIWPNEFLCPAHAQLEQIILRPSLLLSFLLWVPLPWESRFHLYLSHRLVLALISLSMLVTHSDNGWMTQASAMLALRRFTTTKAGGVATIPLAFA